MAADPGHAPGCKIGQLKIPELRAQASMELGDDFDLRNFDDTVLEIVSAPLPALERHVYAGSRHIVHCTCLGNAAGAQENAP